MKQLTDAQRKLIDLDLAKKAIDAYYEHLEEAVKAVHAEVGTDGMFQAEDGTVYKIVKPKGTFVAFKELNYARTKREGEERGSLSAKEAKEAGFKDFEVK